jgi:hypothetical protein
MSAGDSGLEHGGLHRVGGSKICIVVNSVTATEEVLKVSVAGHWSLRKLGVDVTQWQLFVDKHLGRVNLIPFRNAASTSHSEQLCHSFVLTTLYHAVIWTGDVTPATLRSYVA